MAKNLEPMKGKVDLDIDIHENYDWGNPRTTPRIKNKRPQFNELDYESFSTESFTTPIKINTEEIRDIKDFIKFIEEIKKIKGIDLAGLERVQRSIENFGGDFKEKKAIISDFIKINTQLNLMSRNGNKAAGIISENLSQSLKTIQGLKIPSGTERKVKNGSLTESIGEERIGIWAQSFEKILKKIKEIEGINLNELNINEIEEILKNFTGSKEQIVNIIKKIKQISSFFENIKGLTSENISSELFDSLDTFKDIVIETRSDKKKGKKVDNTRYVNRVLTTSEGNERQSAITRPSKTINPNKPSLYHAVGGAFLSNEGDLIEGGERLSIGGQYLGDYEKLDKKYRENYYSAYTKRKELLKSNGFKSIKELKEKMAEAPEDESLKKLYDEVSQANAKMIEWKKKSEELVEQIVKIFENSTEDLQQEFFKKLGSYESISSSSDLIAKAAGKPLEKIPIDTRKSIARILEKVGFESFVNGAGNSQGSPLKAALYQRLKDYQYDFTLDVNDEELSYGGVKEPWEIEEEGIKEERKKQEGRAEKRKEEEYVLQSSLEMLHSEDFKKILSGENGVEIAINIIKQIFGEFENADAEYEKELEKEVERETEEIAERRAQTQIDYLDTIDKEVAEVLNEDANRGQYKENNDTDDDMESRGLTSRSTAEDYRQFLAEQENAEDALQEQVRESLAFRFREGVREALQQLSASAPNYALKSNAIISNLGMLGIERGERATTVEEDERQIYQRISNLLTFSNTVDKAWEEIASERGVSIDEIKEDSLKDEYFRTKYEESKIASEIWTEAGGISSPIESLSKLFGVPKEQSELYKQLPTEEINNLFAALSRLTNGFIEVYKNGELQETIPTGLQAIFNKAAQRMSKGANSPDKGKAGEFYSRSEYKGLELDEDKIRDYSPAERTALFHKAGKLSFEVGATNLAQARKNAEVLLEEEIQRINNSLGEGEIFQDSAKSSRLKQLISEIDALKKSTEELYGIVKKSSSMPLLPFEEQTIEDSKKAIDKVKVEAKEKEGVAEEIQKETETIKKGNEAIEIHTEDMEEASLAEKGKVIVAGNLSKALQDESSLIAEENKALEKHSDTMSEVKIEYEPAQFLGPTKEDPHRHKYISLKTGKEADFTATELAGLAFASSSGMSKKDFDKVSEALNRSYASGDDFSAEALGILDKNTGKVNKKQWEFIKRGQDATLKGTMYHKISELATKFQVDTISELEKKLSETGNEKIQAEYRNLLEETIGKTKILGSELTREDMQSYLDRYMDKMFPKGANGKRNIQKPVISESPMIGRFSLGDESYTVGMSPDEIFLMDYIMATDIKTGRVNPEKNSLQLALNALTLQAGVRQGDIKGIPEKAFDNMELSILHYANDVFTKIIYGLMPKEKIFEILRTVSQGKSIPQEEKAKYNYESSIGLESTYIPTQGEVELPDERISKNVANRYIRQMAELISFEKEIQSIEKEIGKSEQERRVNLEKGTSTIEEDARIKELTARKKAIVELQKEIATISLNGNTLSYTDAEGIDRTVLLSAEELQNLREREDKILREILKNEEKVSAEKRIQVTLADEEVKKANLDRYNNLLEEQYKLRRQLLAIDEKKAKYKEGTDEYNDALEEEKQLEDALKSVESQIDNYEIADTNRDAASRMKVEWNRRSYQDYFSTQDLIKRINAREEVDSFENILKKYKSSNKAVFGQEVEVARAEKKLENYTGSSELEKKALEENIAKQKEILYTLQQQQYILTEKGVSYRDENGLLHEVELTEEQINQLKKEGAALELQKEKNIAKVNATVKEQRSLFDQLADGLKRSLTNLVDYSLAGMAIGWIRDSFTQAIQYTKELDAALTDLQIAAGTTREETAAMLKEYNELAKELGRTTQEVAIASNDWLRAGYLGEEASQLTEASMQLSTLGMTDAASATTNLISVMKGWKLEAEDVGNVVDKLTVILCGVCRAIGIGHESKCR